MMPMLTLREKKSWLMASSTTFKKLRSVMPVKSGFR